MSQNPINNFPKPKFGIKNIGTPPVKKNQPYLLDLVTLEYLYLQSIPESLDNEPTAAWKVVMTPGRNIANYKYVGGEDTISFTLDWYSIEQSRQDVILKCKWLEALTRNDGYDNSPHTVIFGFGELYTDSRFIVFQAPYRLALFNRENGMLPTLASQEVVLKRISEYNPSISEIKSLNR